MAKATEQRVQTLAQFIEALTERFKANEALFADRLEVSERELALLRTLAERGTDDHQARSGAASDVPVSTMTGLVDRMEKKGLLRRVRGPARPPRRSSSRRRRPARSRCASMHADIEAIARGMLEALAERDQQALIAILRRVRERIRKRGPARLGVIFWRGLHGCRTHSRIVPSRHRTRRTEP